MSTEPGSSEQTVRRRADPLPDYLARTYRWAYLDRRLLPFLDRQAVVSAILWGNARRLRDATTREFSAGQRVLQAAAVYGGFSQYLARSLGPDGRLDVVDVAPLQVANVRRKCARLANVRTRIHDLVEPLGESYDGVCCFFLLHEVPAAERAAIVANLLAGVAPGGKVVFTDYHQPSRWHPLGALMGQVFRHLEPYAQSLLERDIETLAAGAERFRWRKRLLFGGLYQVVVAEHAQASAS